MFDKEKTILLREMTGMGLKMAREVLEDNTITVYIHPLHEGVAWSTLSEAMQNVGLEKKHEIKAFTLKLKK